MFTASTGKLLICATLFLLVGSACGAELIGPIDEVLWPLDLSTRYLTSNFMEYRPGRLHAGLDLKTRSRCGYTCRAVESGYISRIRTSHGGYGRAVYLRGESGRTFVYAHLSRLSDPVRAILRDAQREQMCWAVDVSLQMGRLPVAQGDVLALSGQSGAHGPHLHFEVRDGAQRPLNPFGQGFAVLDTFPPLIQLIRAIPAAAGASVAGGLVSRIVTGDQGLTGQLPDLTCSGALAFSAVLLDHADIRAYRLEPWRTEFTVDGREIGTWVNERFAFAGQAAMRLEWVETGGRRERLLHLRPGNDLDGRSGSVESPPALRLEPGIHTAQLVVEDMAGNSTCVAWRLRVVEPTGSVETDSCGWRADFLGVELPPGEAGQRRRLTPMLVVVEDTDGQSTSQDAAIAAAADFDGGGRLVEAAMGIGSAARCVYWVLPDSISTVEMEAAMARQGLRALGPAAEYRAAEWLTTSGTWVELQGGPVDSLDEATAVYRLDDDGEWEVVGPAVGADDGGLAFAMKEPGRHALMRDEAPPWLDAGQEALIVRPSPILEKGGVTLPGFVPLVIGVLDAGSGVNPVSCMAWLDDEPLLVEPDLLRDRLLLELPDDLRSGRHRLDVLVEDGAGNAVRKTVILKLGTAD